MNCPSCNTTLTMSERSGVEIDYCPQCRGVWLDRGELDKIIERSAPPEAPAEPARGQAPPPPRPSAPLHQASGQNSPWAAEGYDHGGYGHGGHSGGGRPGGYGGKPYKKRK